MAYLEVGCWWRQALGLPGRQQQAVLAPGKKPSHADTDGCPSLPGPAVAAGPSAQPLNSLRASAHRGQPWSRPHPVQTLALAQTCGEGGARSCQPLTPHARASACSAPAREGPGQRPEDSAHVPRRGVRPGLRPPRGHPGSAVSVGSPQGHSQLLWEGHSGAGRCLPAPWGMLCFLRGSWGSHLQEAVMNILWYSLELTHSPLSDSHQLGRGWPQVAPSLHNLKVPLFLGPQRGLPGALPSWWAE